MTQTETRSTDRLATRRRHRRLLFGSVAVGVGLVLRGLGYPVAGEAVYWLGIVGFLTVLFGTSTTLFDERDAALERRASRLTLTVAAAVLVLGASAARLLTVATSYAVPTVVWGALYGYAALFAVFGVAYAYARSGR